MAEMKSHHKKSSTCTSRPKYREARWGRAIKVYTINLESKYLLVQGVPALDVTKDLLETFAIYGVIDEYRILDDYPAEEFTNVYWIKFKYIMAARKAKRKLDNRSFFGGILHIAYAPEFETVEETREKLIDRRRVVERKIKCFERDVGDDNGQVEQHTRGRRYVEPETTARYPGPETGHVAENTPEIGGALHIEDRTVLPQLPPPPVNLHPSQFPRVFSKLKRTPTPSPHATKPYHLETMPRTETVQQRYGANKDDVQSKGIKSQRQETIGRHAITKRENIIELASDETLTGNPSLDRTVLSIREKLNQIKNTQPVTWCSENTSEEETKRPLKVSEDDVKETKKKQRKRI